MMIPQMKSIILSIALAVMLTISNTEAYPTAESQACGSDPCAPFPPPWH